MRKSVILSVILLAGSLFVLASILLIITVYSLSDDMTSPFGKTVFENKHIENLANGGRIIITSKSYKTGGWTGPGMATDNLYEYIPPDSNITEFVCKTGGEGGYMPRGVNTWVSQSIVFLALGRLYVRLKDSTWHKFVFTYRKFPGRNTKLGQSLLSLNPDNGGYFRVINVGDENAWLPDFPRGSSILLEESSMLQNSTEPKIYIFVSYNDSKGRRTLKYKLDITRMQLTLIEVRQEAK